MPPQTDLPDLEHNHPPPLPPSPQGAQAPQMEWATKELANERAQDTAIIWAHRRLHANAAEWNRAGGASRALTAAKLSTNWRNSWLQRPPVFKSKHHEATPVSTRRSSEYFRSLSSPCPRTDRHRPPWPLLAVPSRPTRRRTEG